MVGEKAGDCHRITSYNVCYTKLLRLAYDMKDYPRAEQHLQESLTRYKEIDNQHGVASALCRLGYVACASGSDRHQEASQYLNQALEIAAKIGAPPLILDILVGLATLWATDQLERAVELLSLALHHPAVITSYSIHYTKLYDHTLHRLHQQLQVYCQVLH